MTNIHNIHTDIMSDNMLLGGIVYCILIYIVQYRPKPTEADPNQTPGSAHCVSSGSAMADPRLIQSGIRKKTSNSQADP